MHRHVRYVSLGLALCVVTGAAVATARTLRASNTADTGTREAVRDPDAAPAGQAPSTTRSEPGTTPDLTDGALRLADGTFCPLTHTRVDAEIGGVIARVTVTQAFENPTRDRVEAVYTFPLPEHAAVDDMTLHVGDRVVRGTIERREDAQRLYDEARAAGHTAALLEQERPNIFTQAVANIPPGAVVKVVISYVERLRDDDGTCTFVFPMVVGPRYVPGDTGGGRIQPTAFERPGPVPPSRRPGGGWAPDTTQVPDASRISPPVAGVHVGTRGSRAGHDISVTVSIDAGVALQSLRSPTHDVDVERASPRAATVRLRNQREIPNRDFVLTFGVRGADVADALIYHAPGARTPPASDPAVAAIAVPDGGGYFAFVLQPPARVRNEDATPRELIFVLDTSGSMEGFPLETAKAVMRRAIEHLRPGDTFNLVTFAGDTHVLFPWPVDPSAANVRRALQFLDSRSGGGGTEMMAAIRAALGDAPGAAGPERDAQRPGRDRRSPAAIRIVCFMTDGYVGNDMAIIAEVQRHPDARVFSFGIGTAVNRFLLDGMAHAGRGEVEYVLSAGDAVAAADRFYDRVHTPVLTDLSLDWGHLPVELVLPATPPDLFAARPLVLVGRYREPATGILTLRGRRGGRPFAREIPVAFPRTQPANAAIAGLWARERVEALMALDWSGLQQGQPRADVKDAITALGLAHRLVTPFTAFVAVEERTVVEGGRTRTIRVPVEMPAGVRPEGVFGMPGEGVVGGIVGGISGKAKLGFAQSLQRGAAPAAIPAPPAQVQPGARTSAERDTAARDSARPGPLDEKVHPALLERVTCYREALARTTPPAANTCGLGADGRVSVDVWLHTAAADRDLLRRLRAAGLTPSGAPATPDSRRRVSGTIHIDRMEELAAIAEVRLISLRTGS